MTKRGTSQAGFTTHEVLAAIVGGFVLAVVTTGFAGRHENALSGSARRVLAGVQKARLAAVKSSTNHRLVVTGNRLRLERWNGERRQWAAAADVWDAGASGHVLAAPSEIVFGADGAASRYGAIRVRDRDGNSRTVRVSRSGRASVD